jgi:hypothetical protein
MRAAARRAASLALVAAAAVWVAWLGFRVQTGGDYPLTFAPPMNALLGGHIGAFFNLLPNDGAGGSVLLRAPGALLGQLLAGTQLSIFRFGALECVLAAGALGLWLARGMRDRGCSTAARAAVVALCVGVPAILDAILVGHPEEVLGAVLAVAAVLLAADDRPTLSGIALALAIINKPWALLAIAPTLLAAPRRRGRLGGIAAALCAAWFGAAFAAAPGHFVHSLAGLSIVAHPQELWWPLAHLTRDPTVTPGHYLPALITDHARELAVGLMAPLSVPLALRRDRSTSDCLALLALLLALRCLLDPSNHIYYELPFVLALVAWEASTAPAPVLSLLATGLLWLLFGPIAQHAPADVQWLAYVAATIPFIVILGRAAGIVPSRDRHRGRRRLSAVAQA